MARTPVTSLPTMRQVLASVHVRLIAFAVILAGVGLLIGGYLVISGYAQKNVNLIGRTIGYSIEPALVFGDMDAVRQTIRSVAHTDSASRIEVLSPSGTVIESMTRDQTALQRWSEAAFGSLLAPSAALVPVEHDGKAIGAVRVTPSVVPILRYIGSGFIICVCCLGIAVLATRILAKTLQRDVLEPLENVAEVAHAARVARDFNRRVPRSGIAEVDRFSNDFNSLLAELQGWQVSLTIEREELERKASHDPMTGLGNRALFINRIEESIRRAVHNSESFAVLYFDVDAFKAINDTYGHSAGDAALVSIAGRLAKCLRNEDVLFRLGGDEFAAILRPIAGREQVEHVTDRIVRTMDEPMRLPSGEMVRSSVSVGIAVYPDDGIAPSDLVNKADALMYEQKNRFHERPGT